jgi:hypothetical protein
MKGEEMLLYLSTLDSRRLNHYYEIIGQKVSALLSYALLGSDASEMIKELGHRLNSLILDSGAWTDQRSPFPTDIDEYINYLAAAGKYYDFYFNLDQDFNENVFSGTNLKNLLKLEEARLKPVPVIHSLYTGEIEYYLNREYPVVALGSSYATRLDALKLVFERFEKYPTVKIHIFGTTNYGNLIEVPVYSVDSSSWGTQGKFGNICYWNPESDKLDKSEEIYIGGYYHSDEQPKHRFVTYYCKQQLEEYLEKTFHFTYQDLLGDGGYYNMQVINIHHYAELEKRITAEHRKRGFIS